MGKNPYLKDETQEETAERSEARVETPKKKNRKALYAVLAAVFAVVCFFGGALCTWFSLDSEMRSLAKLKYRIQNDYYEEISDGEFYDAVFDGINEKLLDDYSWYMTADDYKAAKSEGKGNQSGIGVTLDVESESGEAQMLVILVSGNSPAAEVGVKEGDYILGYGNTEAEIVDRVVFDDFAAYIDPKATGETFYIKIKSGKDGEPRALAIRKSDFVASYVTYRTNAKSYGFTGEKADEWTESGDPLVSLADNAAYIRLTQFNGAAAEEFETAMSQFKADGKTDLVLDLRGNGGGYLDIMQEIASYFCKQSTEKKPIVAVADYGDWEEEFKAKGNYYYGYFTDRSRVCVLADSSSASASECLLGCMLDYGAIGYGDICLSLRDGVAKTYGKGIMQTTYPLKLFNTDAVKLTTAKIRWPVSDTCIHGRGIVAADGTKTVAESYEKDGELTAALAALFA